ncbi:NADPH-dependent FMN reductase [Methylorubrum extorquens]|uniref:NADPH-dependent FMN reductase n=1 Tax=Methylorubrum extorquens TaxID=408 RepID=UPI000972B047|nr:NAD(P)H-dependent oxidoreductase [Methylorubrum extorquens]APX87086.1 NADPH-dependent FMN reductase [Methylorubrum extorquens]
MTLTVPVILGSVRAERAGIRAARFLVAQLEARGHTAPLVDPAELKLPLLDRMYKEYPKGEAPEPLERLATLFRGADAFVVVSAEYNHSIPPALSNTLDHFLEEYFWRPSAICCYSAGQYGGVRAAMQLRAMLAELGTPSIPSLLPIPRIQKALSEAGEPAEDWLGRAAKKFLNELTWYAEALKAKRAGGTPY